MLLSNDHADFRSKRSRAPTLSPSPFTHGEHGVPEACSRKMSHLPSKPMDVARSPNIHPARSPNPPDRDHIPYPPDIRAPNPYRYDDTRVAPARDAPPAREGAGYSRAGFAPVSSRHADMERRDSGDRGYERGYDEHDRRDDRYDDYDRKRRRSPSPSYPSHRARLSVSPPRRDYRSSALASVDPALVPHQLNFKQFAEWFRASHPHTAKQDDDEWRQLRDDVERGILPEAALKNKIGMARRFDRYRKEYYSRQLYSVFLTHRASAWFVERYSPASAALRRRVNRSGRVPAVVQFISALRAGEYASVSFDENAPPRPNAMDRPLEDGDDKRVEIDAPSGQVFVKTVPPTTRRVDLEKLFGKAKGFQWLALSDPSVKKAFHRVGWAQYAEGTDPEMVVRAVDGQKIDMFTFHMGINNTPSIGRVRFAPSACGTLAQLEADLERAKELAIMLEDDLVESDEDKGDAEAAAGNTDSNDAQAERQPMPWDRAAPLHERGSRHVQNTLDAMDQPDFGGDVDAARLAQTKSALDLWIAYLRYGLHTCFYCLAPCSFAEELHRKCIAHVRSPPERDDQDKIDKEERGADRGDERDERDRDERDPKADRRPAPNSKSSDERWLELFDNKFRAMVKGDVADAGGRDVADKLAAPYIKKETADKYRCKQCDKLFRAPEFVIKHVASKHGELVSDKLEEVSLFNAFVRDATHLQPDKNTPASIDDKLPAPLLPLIEGMMGGFGAASRTPSRIGNTGPAVNPALMPGAAGMDGPGFNLQQQMMMMLQMGMMMGTGGGSGGSGGMGGGVMGAAGGMSGIGMGVMGGGTGMAGPMSQRPRRDLDAPPASGPTNEDPRASRGRVSYLDLDEEPGGGGDGGLPY